jgi:hypothetical protein
MRQLGPGCIRMPQLRLAIRRPNDSGSGSEEENMSNIALSHKAAKLMKLCELEGYKRLDDLLKASFSDSICPAICTTEGCDNTTEMGTAKRAAATRWCPRSCSLALWKGRYGGAPLQEKGSTIR